MSRIVTFVILLWLGVMPAWGHSRMALFLPDDTPFWNRVALFARAAAGDLDVQLTVFDADADRLKLLRQLDQVSGTPDRFDAWLFPNFLRTAEDFLVRCQRLETACILFNSGLADDRPGTPRHPNPHWIAQLIPDDTGSSMAVTRELIRQARQGNTQRPITIAGVNGYQADAPAIKREEGLRKVVAEARGVKLKQVFYTDWGARQAYIRTTGLLHRYPDVNVIWSANYRTTNGILRALEDKGLSPGRDVLVNAYDINPQALNQVSEGRVAVTAGGHYVEGAWAVILAHDYLAGRDFQDQGLVFHTPLLIVTRDNVETIRAVLGRIEQEPESLYRVDFSRYSRAANPDLEDYDFSLQDLLRDYQEVWALEPGSE
ncbi:ABC transporter substrate-binding protein [Marinobacter halodurans]|uniref:ABC transporter substrate-binding protein n=1 Tax=Marinobacter halodurans TaxID=2528979 RepID=UPI0013F16322|nr:ABC transporter substrate-binding protein [Marinobacter halodurans]